MSQSLIKKKLRYKAIFNGLIRQSFIFINFKIYFKLSLAAYTDHRANMIILFLTINMKEKSSNKQNMSKSIPIQFIEIVPQNSKMVS